MISSGRIAVETSAKMSNISPLTRRSRRCASRLARPRSRASTRARDRAEVHRGGERVRGTEARCEHAFRLLRGQHGEDGHLAPGPRAR